MAHWHLGLAEKERHWQTGHLLEHALFRESSHLPTLVVGDSNDWRNTLARAAFADHNFKHITTPISRFRTFPAWFPIGSLDKVYARGEIFFHAVRVVGSALAQAGFGSFAAGGGFSPDRRSFAGRISRRRSPHGPPQPSLRAIGRVRRKHTADRQVVSQTVGHRPHSGKSPIRSAFQERRQLFGRDHFLQAEIE